jgi:large subunit ribosomal protein L18
MIKKESRNSMRVSRHERIRKTMMGTSEVPRLSVFRSNAEIYAQIIDDEKHVTVCSASSVDKELKEKLAHGGNIESAKVVGEAIAKKAKAAGIECVVFDRGGFLYHGRVAALADAAREAGLMF